MLKKTKNPSCPDWIIVVAQTVAYLITAIPLRLIYRAKKTLPKNIKLLRSGSLIASNHQSRVDPFFVVMSLPFWTYLRILPIRFPAADWVDSSPIFNPPFFPLMTFLGSFTIGNSNMSKMRAAFYMRKLLRDGKTVVLFPEGSVTDEHTVKELQGGIDFFIHDAKNVMFVRLKGFNTYGSRSITFGEVFEPPPKMTVEEMQAYLERL